MGRFVNPDNSAFQVALNSPIYVDKTGLLEYTNSVLNTTEAYICNSRPRRFGKSYAANMLAAYYSKDCNSEEMFSGLDISRIENGTRNPSLSMVKKLAKGLGMQLKLEFIPVPTKNKM